MSVCMYSDPGDTHQSSPATLELHIVVCKFLTRNMHATCMSQLSYMCEHIISFICAVSHVK